MSAMKKKLDRLSYTLGSMLKARGLGSRLSEYRVFGLWEKTVGPVIARHAQPQAVRGKKLTLVVDSPAWMQQLSLLKPEIMEKVNSILGKKTINDITLRLGEVESQAAPPEEPPVRSVLNQDERGKIEDYVRGISDPDTREAVRRVIEKDFLSRKQGR
jgi:predicted nucleic acid-binding Zn ribbon protein